MEFDVKCTYFGLQVTNSVLLLFDIHSQQADFLLHALDFFGVFLVLFLELSEEVVSLLL